MENWCWERELIDIMGRHYITGEPLPDDLYRKMIQAKNFQSGMQMVRQLELVHGGETAIDPGMAARAVDTAARLQRDEFWPGARQGLTQRESEILSFVVNGLSNRAIATKLVIGDETVKTHLSSIYRKLGVSDRTGAVATALREGIYQ